MAAERFGGIGVSEDFEQFWSALPEKVEHPQRRLVVEALWRTGRELTPRTVVDALDGQVTMWEASHHLRELEALGVVESISPGEQFKGDEFDALYRLAV